MLARSRHGARSARLLAAAVVLATALPACGGSGRVDDAVAASTSVGWESDDGTRIEGRLFGDGSVGVVLAHMFPADQTSWYDFASTLADEGYTALTFNFRGYCPGGHAGCSEGERTIPEIWRDVASAAIFLAAREEVDQVVVVGASMGGTAALIVAALGEVPLAGVATLSAPLSFEGLAIDTGGLASIRAAKLFVAGAQDGSAAEAAQALFDGSNPPKDIEIVPVADHGTDLLTGTRGEVVRRRLLTFLQVTTGGPGAA